MTLIQQLFREEFVSFEGEYYRTHNATIYDKPDEPVPIYIAASGPAAARLAGRIGGRAHLHLGQGRGAVHGDAAPGGRGGGGQGRARCERVSAG